MRVCTAPAGSAGAALEKRILMSTPKRIQRRRTKGWRKPEGAVLICRPGKWGNPFPIGKPGPLGRIAPDAKGATGFFQDMFRAREIMAATGYPSIEQIRHELAGKDLVCWCKVGEWCHGDVLLEIANAPTKCHYITYPDGARVLFPYCMGGAVYGDIKRCTCA